MNVLSLCDYSGKWARPYADEGHFVVLVDPKHPSGYASNHPVGLAFGGTVADFLAMIHQPGQFFGRWRFDVILAAPPCTHFASSGARWFKEKDADGRTEEHAQIVRDILEIVDICKPRVFALENPVGRIERVVPELRGKKRLMFDPCDYAGHADDPQGEAYTKRTCLWGWFNADLPQAPVEPIMYERGGKRGSWMWANLGGKSERTKELRSNTPDGFARAFYRANSSF